jgi:hypothetical protein
VVRDGAEAEQVGRTRSQIIGDLTYQESLAKSLTAYAAAAPTELERSAEAHAAQYASLARMASGGDGVGRNAGRGSEGNRVASTHSLSRLGALHSLHEQTIEASGSKREAAPRQASKHGMLKVASGAERVVRNGRRKTGWLTQFKRKQSDAAGKDANGLKRLSGLWTGAEALVRIGQENTKDVARLVRGRSGTVLNNQVDLERLFWWRKPTLMLRVFQYCYFENALSLAVVVFALWQHEGRMFAGVGTEYQLNVKSLAVTLSLLLLDLILLFHSAAFVLPLYALTRAAAMYCRPGGAVEYARKQGLRPDLVDYLENTDQMVRVIFVAHLLLRECADLLCHSTCSCMRRRGV